MKKFETAQLEIVKLNMADIIATSDNPVCQSNTMQDSNCPGDGFAKGDNWDED